MLIIGRLPSTAGSSLQGQHRVTLGMARNLPVQNKVLTLLKRGGALKRLFQMRVVKRRLEKVSFEEV